MRIIVTDLNGKEVDKINTNPITLEKQIEEVMRKYPKGKFHATLETY
jgi:hypothetical protein